MCRTKHIRVGEVTTAEGVPRIVLVVLPDLKLHSLSEAEAQRTIPSRY
jgi:hypothetical protein